MNVARGGPYDPSSAGKGRRGTARGDIPGRFRVRAKTLARDPRAEMERGNKGNRNLWFPDRFRSRGGKLDRERTRTVLFEGDAFEPDAFVLCVVRKPDLLRLMNSAGLL
jgi:hypothetical protein